MNPNLIIIICIILWGVWGFTNKLCNMQNAPVFVTLATNILYAACSLPLLFKVKYNEINWSMSAMGWLLLTAGLGVGAKLLFNTALSKAPASIVVSATSVFPLVTVLLAAFFLREKINLQQGVGLCLCVSGVYLMTLGS